MQVLKAVDSATRGSHNEHKGEESMPSIETIARCAAPLTVPLNRRPLLTKLDANERQCYKDCTMEHPDENHGNDIVPNNNNDILIIDFLDFQSLLKFRVTSTYRKDTVDSHILKCAQCCHNWRLP
jgi:hypothetical protein